MGLFICVILGIVGGLGCFSLFSSGKYGGGGVGCGEVGIWGWGEEGVGCLLWFNCGLGWCICFWIGGVNFKRMWLFLV